MNGSELIASILSKEGVAIMPAFPYSDLIEAGTKFGIRPIIVRQERHALHIADGYARTTAGCKICCTAVQHGPGSENSVGAIAQCYADNVPVLHIPGGYARESQGVAPNFSAARNMQFLNKWCEVVPVSGRIPQMLQHAFALLRNGRPGPVTLEVPIDIMTEEVDPSLAAAYKVQRRSTPIADPKDIADLANAILRARAPVIVAGQGILYAEACRELLELAELTQIPVMSTLNGKSCFPENHPLALGCAGYSRPDQVIHFLDKADLIIGLGTSFTRSDYITPFPTEGRIFAQLTNWEGDISKDYPVDLGVIGDAKLSLAAVIEVIKGRIGPDGRKAENAIAGEVAAVKSAFMAKWMPHLTSEEEPISPYRVVWDLMHTVDRRKTVVTHDAGTPRDQVTAFYETIVPHGYMGWGKTTQLGMGLGLMHGARLARPDWNCINIMGDAAFGMTGMDFETGVRNQIGVTTIVLKNSVMGGYTRHHPEAAKKYSIEKLGGNYAAMATAMGGHGESVDKPADIKPALRRALAQNAKGMPALIEIITREEVRIPNLLPKM
ncbi:thiamine pyrophosphate-requiring protein [Taklimakanibacter deserti]|uniref:thiamine pyrophosphate-requiring protein n=1 Tax=Taklimakanibacter deserti TaxID=2267839 RepID=UPI0013C50586